MDAGNGSWDGSTPYVLVLGVRIENRKMIMNRVGFNESIINKGRVWRKVIALPSPCFS